MKIIVVPENKAQNRQKFGKMIRAIGFRFLPNKIGKIAVIIVLALTTLPH